LLAIAKHTLGGEMDRRMALKRGAGKKPVELIDDFTGDRGGQRPDREYEQAVFHAKVEAALRMVERETGLMDFSVYRMRDEGCDILFSSLGLVTPSEDERSDDDSGGGDGD